MWDVIGELGRAVREGLKDWPGTLRLLCVLARLCQRPNNRRSRIAGEPTPIKGNPCEGDIAEVASTGPPPRTQRVRGKALGDVRGAECFRRSARGRPRIWPI
jgi:hypothetical protein